MKHDPIISAARPSYEIRESDIDLVVRVTLRGFFDKATLIRHFDDKASVVSRWRECNRPIRVMINAHDLQPHTPENQAYVMKSIERIYRPGDRMAIMVGSTIVKMQMRRSYSYGDIISFFISEEAALKWLLAYD